MGVRVYELDGKVEEPLAPPTGSVLGKGAIARCMNIMPFLYGFIAAKIAACRT